MNADSGGGSSGSGSGSGGGTLAPGRTLWIEAAKPLLGKNAARAEANRRLLAEKGVAAVNLLSSPGAGKTALLERTLAELRASGGPRAAVIVGDLATDNDARRLADKGAPIVQITTGSACHLEADMIDRALGSLDLDALDLLFVENVGNLVCPAGYDLGESARAVLLSVTEGEDKPLKYPLIYKTADAVLITKTDAAGAMGFDADAARGNVAAVAPGAVRIELSSRTGEGFGAWMDWLRGLRPRVRV